MVNTQTSDSEMVPVVQSDREKRAWELLADVLGYRAESAQRASFLAGNMIPIVFPSDAIAAMLTIAAEADAAAIERAAGIAENQRAEDWFEVGKVVVATGKYIATAIRASQPAAKRPKP